MQPKASMYSYNDLKNKDLSYISWRFHSIKRLVVCFSKIVHMVHRVARQIDTCFELWALSVFLTMATIICIMLPFWFITCISNCTMSFIIFKIFVYIINLIFLNILKFKIYRCHFILSFCCYFAISSLNLFCLIFCRNVTFFKVVCFCLSWLQLCFAWVGYRWVGHIFLPLYPI